VKILGIKTVKLKKIVLPGNWPEILKRPSAAERGKSIAEHGLIHEPVVRKTGGRMVLVAGRDRVAGMELEGMKEVQVKVIECSDDEAADIEELENIERRHDKEEVKVVTAKRLKRLAALLEKEPPPSKRGRPKLATTKAREQIAKEKGVTPRAVEMAERRRKKKAAAAMADLIPEEEPGHCIRLVGVDVEEEDLEVIAEIQGYIDLAATALTTAARELGILAGKGLPIPEGPLDRLRQAVKDCGATCRGMRPTVLCPFCKMVPGAVEQCAGCGTTGWLGPVDGMTIAEELWEEENPQVIVQGQLVYVSSLFADDEEEDLGLF